LLISLAYSFAEVPCKINYQGRLIKDNVPVDGTEGQELYLEVENDIRQKFTKILQFIYTIVILLW